MIQTIKMDILRGDYTLLFCIFMEVVVLCRGANSADKVPTDGQDYWPTPRDLHTASSAYIRDVPDSLVPNPYEGQAGPYMDFYQYYDRYAKDVGGNWTDFPADTHVCANYQSFGQKYIGVFKCPMPHVPKEYTSCCGINHIEFCCLPQSFMDDQTSEHLVGEILFFILLAIVFSIGAALWTVAGAWSSIKAARREKLEEKELLAAA